MDYPEATVSNEPSDFSGTDIAIVGMAGRFPQAKNIEEFWRNISQGLESISFFSDEELAGSGVPARLINDPNYVKARAVLDDADLFDAEFFGINPREAEILDPQHRLFLECSWEAIEAAGYDAERYKGRIGVYAGSSLSTYLLNLYSDAEALWALNPIQVLIANDKDFLTTRVSYKLNLKGPSVVIQTACSTSLVAVHFACQSLLNGECDMALAGGVSIRVPQRVGHLYQQGSILSPDGHCRTFDAEARGTVSGDGVGVVLLKRLEDAVTDRDYIHAVIKGSAINNDGSMKTGYTAPSVQAQAAVIAEAQTMSRVDAESVSYIEAHGTATELGDPIELAALTKAFRASTEKRNFCAIGSVKTNLGHLDAAAGVVGLIKAVMAINKKQLPPSLHYERPNPKLNIEDSPFYVNTTLRAWEADATPRRAGISSFGIGGTNAHIIIEEAPSVEPSGRSGHWQLLVLSAKTDTALHSQALSLAQHLKRNPNSNLADVAYTLKVGRRAFGHRRIVVCSDLEGAVRALEMPGSAATNAAIDETYDRPVVFMFPGQGSQYVNMAKDLYDGDKEFREVVDHCSELLTEELDYDLRGVIYPDQVKFEEASARLNQTFFTQPSLFVIEYALAKLWMRHGVLPKAMIGHSIGEYVAACVAGVFSLKDALTLVAARAKLMQSLPPGLMLAVPLPDEDVLSMIPDSLSLAAINSPRSCVISGLTDEIEQVESVLSSRGVKSHRLRTSHAFHSAMSNAIVEPFIREVMKVELNEPKIPFISNLTGTWITAQRAKDPFYWAEHMRQTVLFSQGIWEVLKGFDGVLLEVGPGTALSTFAKQHQEAGTVQTALPSLRHAQAEGSDAAFLLNTLGKLWLNGVRIGWADACSQEQRLRVPLPTYQFERRRFWIEPSNRASDRGLAASAATLQGNTSKHPRPQLSNAFVAPSTELEQALADIWQELLGVAELGIYDDFFVLGGHSLLATQLLSKLREIFDVDIPLHRLFEATTIAALAIEIEELLLEKIENLTDVEAQSALNTE